MNYQAAAALMGGMGPDGSLPIGIDWRRVNYSLAGYGYVVPGTLSDAVPANLEISAVPTAVLTITLRGG